MSNEMKTISTDIEDGWVHISSASDGHEVYYNPDMGMYRVRIFLDGVLKYETWFDEVEPTPRKPLLIDGKMRCPKCKMNEGILHHYCHICGQPIDWSVDNA